MGPQFGSFVATEERFMAALAPACLGSYEMMKTMIIVIAFEEVVQSKPIVAFTMAADFDSH